MVVIANESIEVWDPGVYPARVLRMEQTTSTYPGSEGKARLKWVFQVKNEDDETSEVWYWTGATLSKHERATFRPLVRVLLPELDLDDPAVEVDTDEMLNKRCRVILGIDQEKGRNTIEKVLPAEVRKVAKPVKEPVAAGATEEDAPPPF